MMSSWLQDLRHALRGLRKSPGFAIVAVAVLALGIGANTAIFSVVHGVLMRPLPYPGPDDLMQVETVFESGASGNVSDPDFRDLREWNHSFSSLAAYSSWTTSAVTANGAVRVELAAVSHDFFEVLGVHPRRGRAFLAREERAGRHVAVVSHDYWRRQLGGASVDGQAIRLGDQVFDVVGVMPEDFAFPPAIDVWILRHVQTASRTAQNWHVVGRLRHGVTRVEAQREMTGLAHRIKREYGEDTYMTDVAVRPLSELLTGDVRPALMVLLGAAVALLLVACVNIANLLLARAMARDREVALRLALGSGAGRLAWQFLAESLLLCWAGSVLGVILAAAGVPALLALEPRGLPRVRDVGLDWTMLVFALGVAVIAALAIGLVPALRALRRDARETLGGQRTGHGGSVASRRVRGALVASQVALTIALLVGVGLLARSFIKLSTVDPGYRTRGALVMDLWLPSVDDAAGRTRNAGFLARLMTRLRRIPAVEHVGGVNVFPLEGSNAANGTFLVLGRPDEVTSFDDFERLVHQPTRTGKAEYRVASEGYFAAMGIPLIRGRLFDDRDAADAPHVAVISASLAQRRWPGQDPLGKLIQFGNMDGDLRPFTIIGVVGDVREAGLGAASRPTFYASYRQRAVSDFHVAIQVRGDIGALTGTARRMARELGPDVPVRFQTLDEVVSRSMADRRFVLLLMSLFAGLALLLATTGVYGVIAYTASRRTSEIGVRMALGARRSDVVRLLMRQGTRFVAAGIVAGVMIALLLTRFLTSFCYGVTPTDPASFVMTCGLLFAAAAAASWLPARRAARIDPMEALRNE